MTWAMEQIQQLNKDSLAARREKEDTVKALRALHNAVESIADHAGLLETGLQIVEDLDNAHEATNRLEYGENE